MIQIRELNNPDYEKSKSSFKLKGGKDDQNRLNKSKKLNVNTKMIELSNKVRLGKSETELMIDIMNCTKKIIQREIELKKEFNYKNEITDSDEDEEEESDDDEDVSENQQDDQSDTSKG